jgi:hypothetical protein
MKFHVVCVPLINWAMLHDMCIMASKPITNANEKHSSHQCVNMFIPQDRLYGLVVRVTGYRSRSLRLDSRRKDP